jgi:ubiquinone biosynthesis protein
MTGKAPRLLREAVQFSWRAAYLAGLMSAIAVSLVPDWVVLLLSGRRQRFPARAARRLRRMAPLVGPSFVKILQLVGTRPDVLAPEVCQELSALCDAVPPMRQSTARRLLAAWLPDSPLADVSLEPVASGSIACVYRARLRDGREVALKLRRPRVDSLLQADLCVLRRTAGLLCLLPPLRQVPVRELVDQLSLALGGQLDLRREAANLTAIRDHLAEDDGIFVPAVFEELSSEGLLALEFVPALARHRAQALDPEVRCAAARRILGAVYQMLFLDGLVHCDLHPGNLYVRSDGTLVILDAGFVRHLTPTVRKQFTEFFFRMGTGNEKRAADIVIETAIRQNMQKVDEFRAELGLLVRANSGLSIGEFSLGRFAAKLFDLQRRYGLYADANFVFPILSLLVIEKTTRELDPMADFQGLAIPHLMQSLFASP